MIVSCAPFRVSFVGGGSDIPSFYLKHGGAVLSCTIAKYSFAVIHSYLDGDKYNIKYALTETVDTVEEIRHPLFRECVKMLNVEPGIEINSIADIRSGTGLGSSSSFCVALLNGLHAYQRRFVEKTKLAEQACEVEIDRLREPVGRQDQYAAAWGGLNFIEFSKNGAVSVQPLLLDQEIISELENGLMLFYSGIQRDAGPILDKQTTAINNDGGKIEMLKQMVENTYALRNTLTDGDLRGFGQSLHANWLLKRSLTAEISSPHIDRLYDKAIKNGALGGKLAGAGGGGFFVFYCPPEKQPNLRKALSELTEVEFKFDWTGARIILAEL